MTERYLLAERILADLETTISEEEWEDRKKNFHETLCEQLSIDKLQGSVVEFEFETGVERLMILAYLVPRRQRQPTLSGISEYVYKLFLADVQLVKRAQKELRNLYETALKSDADPRANPELARRRRQMWNARRRGLLTIYSTLGGEDLPLHSVDRLMPNAELARMTFSVDGISRSNCRVRILSLMPMLGEHGNHSPCVHMPSGSVDLSRDQLALGCTAGQVLSKAMEERRELQATIRLEFSWVDGTLSRLTLLEIPTEAVLDASNTTLALSTVNCPVDEVQTAASVEDMQPAASPSVLDEAAHFSSFWECLDEASRRAS